MGLTPECRNLCAVAATESSPLDPSSAQASLSLLRTMELTSAVACAEAAATLSDVSPREVAGLFELVANHPACLAELTSKSEAETRCSQKLYKVAISTLVGAKDRKLADDMWQRATSIEGATIAWPSAIETPTLWVRGLRQAEVWDCSSWSFVRALEDSSAEILEELRNASSHMGAAYSYLSQSGLWQNMFPFRQGSWNADMCKLLPTTCGLLMPELPTLPDVPFQTPNNEEVVIFRSEANTHVGEHCGATNNQVNIHLTLTGGEGTLLQVGDGVHELHDGRALCFQDSYSHSLEHRGDSERISLVVRVMHPDMHRDLYRDAPRTDAVDLASWDAARKTSSPSERSWDRYRRHGDTSRNDTGAFVAPLAAGKNSEKDVVGCPAPSAVYPNRTKSCLSHEAFS